MNLISRVFILSVCVFTACALPSFGNLDQLHNDLIDTLGGMGFGHNSTNNTGNSNNTNNNTSNATTGNSQNGCLLNYSIQLDKINAETVVKSEQCYASARMALSMMNENVNKTHQNVNRQSLELQNRLAYCSRQNSSEAVFNCYAATFDQNLGNLYNITVQAQVASAALSGYEFEVGISTQACVGQVLVENKSNSTVAATELELCLQNEQSANRTRLLSLH